MSPLPPLRRAAAGLALATLLGLSACNTTLTVSPEKVAEQAAAALAPKLGYSPKITCPKALEGKVGTTMECQLTAQDGATHKATVTVTEVKGTNVNFDVVVG